jgi:DNA-binding response OmpR family regulator/tetratricopeptide (TPR) repeat protein
MAASATNTNRATNDCEPIVLVVGDEPRFNEIQGALIAHGFAVQSCPPNDIVKAVNSTAPDLALLVGGAAQQSGTAIIERLSGDAAGAVVPLVLLAEGVGDKPNQPFKHGVVALIERQLTAHAIAKRLQEIASELPERPGSANGDILGEATLDELVSLLSKELRSGVLSLRCKEKGEEQYGAKIVLRSGHPVTEDAEAFIQRVRPLLDEKKGTAYRFQEQSSGRVDSVTPPQPSDVDGVPALRRRRILLVCSDRERSENLARALRKHEALVVTISGSGVELERGRNLDPEVILVDSADFTGPCSEIMESVRDDLRMRWASILIYSSDPHKDIKADLLEIGPLANKIAKLTRPDRDLLQRATFEKSFDTRLEIIGPSRTLRAIAQARRALRVTLRHPRVLVEIDLADGSIMGARAENEAEGSVQPLVGTSAMAAFMALGSCKVHVEELAAAELSNLVSPVDLTLALAAAEAAPVGPSALPGPSAMAPEGAIAPAPLRVAASARPAPAFSQKVPKQSVADSANADTVPPPRNTRSESEWWLDSVLPAAQNECETAELSNPTASNSNAAQLASSNSNAAQLASSNSNAAQLASSNSNAAQLGSPQPAARKGGASATPYTLEIAARLLHNAPKMNVRASNSPRRRKGATFRALSPVILTPTMRLVSDFAIALAVLALIATILFGAGQYSRSRGLWQALNQIKQHCTALIFGAASERASNPSNATNGLGASGPGSATQSHSSSSLSDDHVSAAPHPPEQQPGPASDGLAATASASQLANIGDRLRGQGRIDDAESFYQRALKEQADHPGALIGMVRVSLIRKEGEQALLWAAILVQQHPDRSIGLLLLGDAYALKGDLVSAHKAWKQASRLGNRTARQRLR